MRDPLFFGPDSIRDEKERAAMVWCIAALPLSLGLVGLILSSAFSASHLLLIGIGALLYVSIARGRLLGDSIHVHTGQMSELAQLVADCARVLDIDPPQIFIRDDPLVPIVAVGIGEPYALVISTHWLRHLDADELRFLVGRELAHIRAGHTRITSMLSVNGRENVAVSLVLGGFLRRTEYTADRVGLLCCGSQDKALRAIAIASFHSVAREVDVGRVAEQLREIEAEPSLRAGEWLASSPYATRRMSAVAAFSNTPLARIWLERFAQARTNGLAASERPRRLVEAQSQRGFAGPWRRIGSWIIDMIVVLAIMPSIVTIGTPPSFVNLQNVSVALPTLVGAISGTNLVLLWLYSILLVSVAGRTVGMMVTDLRVLSADFGRPTLLQVVRRYALAGLSFLAIFPLLLWGLRRVQPYDKYSGTRLVSASALFAERAPVA
ncbi:MAG: RDD family protein [Candidatus Eremiobacteraeota bacterium]|nr:RDD family protein [Candidatus Eremiobacteraeota bacterium]